MPVLEVRWKYAIGLAALALATASPAAAQLVAKGAGCVKDSAQDSIISVRIYPIIPLKDKAESDTEYNFRVEQAKAVLPFIHLASDSGKPEFTISCPNCRASYYPYRTVMWFQVADDGRLSGARVTHSSWDSTLDYALARAVLAADSAHALKPLPPALAHQPVDLWIGFAPQYEADSSAIVTPLAGERHVRVDTAHWTPPVRESGPDPKSVAAVNDTVVISFIVDTAGVPIGPSAYLEHADYRETAAEALRVFLNSHYRPAELGGCKVPVQVVQIMQFKPKK